jgi:hypothetical protein
MNQLFPRAAVLAGMFVLVFWPSPANAHCDTLDGPVVKAARAALAANDVAMVLQWVKPEHEGEIRAAFDQTIRVRKAGPDAQALADRYFFETLVRVHRLGEGAPYTGLKPAGSVEPAIALADGALQKGSPDALTKELTDVVARGLRERFDKAAAAASGAKTSVDAGRAFVAAYVDFIHYAERIHVAATTTGPDEQRSH